MTKATIDKDAAPGAAAELVAEAKKEIEVTDARGRKITLRKPGILQQTRLPKVLGPEIAQNITYLMAITPVIYVTAIDGDPVPYPGSDSEIEATLQRLDEDGMAAVMLGIEANFRNKTEAEVEAAKGDIRK